MSDAGRADWQALLKDAVTRPGVVAAGYRFFWNYSVGNQLLALFECHRRRIKPGPLNTYRGWQKLGRHVTKGQKAITLCMPVTCKARRTEEGLGKENEEGKDETFTRFVYRPNWFVLSQTEGTPYTPPPPPDWSEERALAVLGISRIPFDLLNGNCQGYVQGTCLAVSPIAFAPHRTLFHELAHVVLGHTSEGGLVDDERTARNLREVEAECVALLGLESLGLAGSEFSRGYIQHWLGTDAIPDTSAKRIFKTADRILRAGRPIEPANTALEPM